MQNLKSFGKMDALKIFSFELTNIIILQQMLKPNLSGWKASFKCFVLKK